MIKPETKLRIDIASDVVCPWCIVGYRQLATALEESGVEAEIHWHPFELNPQMAPEGENLRDHLAAKYGTTPEQSAQARERLTALGETLGFEFNFADDKRMYNTFDAHRLIHWAQLSGRGHDLKLALFTAYFTNGLDISDHGVLAATAGEIGLDEAEAKKVLEEGRFAGEVRGQENFWLENGVHSVPAMVFQKQHPVSGAQGVENYRRIISQLTGGEV